MDIVENGLSAALGGAVSTSVLYPFNVIATKLATSPSSVSGHEILLKTIKEGGITGLFQGLSPKILQSVLGKFLYFVFFSSFQRRWRFLNGGTLATSQELVCGYVAEMCHLPLTLPLEIVTTRMQKESSSIMQVVKDIVRENGVSGFWKGWKIYLFLSCQPAIQFTIFEKLKRIWLNKSGKMSSLSSLDAFVLGAFARAVAILMTYPFTRVRKVLQTQAKVSGEEKNKKKGKGDNVGVLFLLAKIVEEEGILSLYKGFIPELVRGVLSSALMLMIKEKVKVKLT